MTWLSEIATTGVIPPVADLVHGAILVESTTVVELSVDIKGKGKSRETGMIDITAITNSAYVVFTLRIGVTAGDAFKLIRLRL